MKKYFLYLLPLLVLVSCVSSSKYDAMVAERDNLQDQKDSLITVANNLNQIILEKNTELKRLRDEKAEMQKLYDELKDNSTAGALDMIKKLEALQKDIADREEKLSEVKRKLEEREQRIQKLKNKVQQALLGFEESGLSVNLKNGKVYVSLSNKLLFSTGSTEIDNKGKDALIELAKVLQEQKDINVLVEGHTDNQPIKGGGRFEDNWDLSVLRATEVVRYLTVDGGLNPIRVTASGKGEYFPLEEGDSPEARAINRRTEIILTPKLEELFNILN